MAKQLPERFLFRYLDTLGDGTGVKQVIGNYVTEEEFYIQAPIDTTYKLHRLIAYIEDFGTFDSGGYGNGSALTNGITLKVLDSDDSVLLDLTDGIAVKQNGHWAKLCYDADHKSYGTGNEYLAVRWTFDKAGEAIILLAGQRLVLTVNDDLSGLVEHTFLVQGLII